MMMSGVAKILERLKIPFHAEAGHHHCRPGWLQLDCPFCGEDSHKFHLGYNLNSGYWHCWKCGGLYETKVLKALGATRDDFQTAKEGRSIQVILPQKRLGLKEPDFRGPLQKAHREYLRSRRVDPKEAERIWGLEGIGLATNLSWRIYIPIYFRLQRVSWTTRTIGAKNPRRYISASAEEEAMNHKDIVYGLNYCSHSVVIVEGPGDAWRIGPGAGALFGTTFSSSQLLLLSRIPYRFICLDSGAETRARKLESLLFPFPGRTEVIALDANDPGEASEKELRLLRKIAKLT